MCELFGFHSPRAQDVRGFLTEFYSHSERHSHGWGFASFQKKQWQIVTEPVCANKSDRAADEMHTLPPQTLMIGHIRLASIGGIQKENCHPFTRTDSSGRQWVLAHNGTVYNGMVLQRYQKLQQGSTDSERILLYLMDQINDAIARNGAPLSLQQRSDVLERAIAPIAERNKLNLLISDGEQLYAHCNIKQTLYRKTQTDTVVIATVPLDDGEWEPFELCKLFVYRGGRLVYTGKEHPNEFVEALSRIDHSLEFDL